MASRTRASKNFSNFNFFHFRPPQKMSSPKMRKMEIPGIPPQKVPGAARLSSGIPRNSRKISVKPYHFAGISFISGHLRK